MPRRAAYHEPAPPACCSCCCGGCDPAPAAPPPCYYPAPVPVPMPAPCYYPAPVPTPPSSSASDHLLHALAAHLLLGSSTPAPASAPPPPPPPAAHHATNPYPYPHHYQQQEAKPHAYAHPPQQHQHQPPQPTASDQSHLLLHSLLRRVAVLESALPRCIPPPPPSRRTPHPDPRHRQAVLDDEDDDDEDAEESPPSPPRQRRPTRAGPSSSARDLAARTIQAHFRRFLARRSRTLRQLKELAVLRSQSASLRGSLSGRRGRGADPAAVSEAAMGLLFRLDAIQGGDPMIREGKRAVSRELTRILEFVDKVLVKEHEQLPMGAAFEDNEEDCHHEGCSAEYMSNRPAVNRKVSFSSNGQVHELVNGETQSRKEVDEGSDQSESSAGSDEVKPGKRNANGGKSGLAAPMPVHMETRRVDGERR
ncbi:hypothetical protein EJB05_36838 [Eragrostis curvula]|uniref:BAG domain-containing protein n=1 Tax=Eragrostis curvula TaxID=38414 RepID=A0A5J9UAI2_9POAL|nr:hypothetical protein EJB05_36838 [Eragrostis curvula]